MKDINDYLARVVMGYRKTTFSSYEDIDDILFGDTNNKEMWYDGDKEVMEVRHWNPLENVYQARAVLRKLVEDNLIKEME